MPAPPVAAVAATVVVLEIAAPGTAKDIVPDDTAPADPVDTPPADTPIAAGQPGAFALPVAPDPQSRAPAPAAEVFGAAIRAAAGKDDDATPRRDTLDGAPQPLAVAGLEPQRHAVHAVGETQQAPLDGRAQDFPDRMIDRIEQMRDAANANDTRIRLVPDALGTIDVTMRRDGGTVHVHFAAEQSATRALLSDAQPRLVEIAQARGLSLGQTSVGAGDGGARQQQPQSRAPTPAWQPPRETADASTPDDTRIA